MTANSNHHPPRPPALQFAVLTAFVAVTFCAPVAGMFAPPGEWYAGLVKPEWNPPSWIFGPVWTLLYFMMAVAAWLVWKREGWHRALAFYAVQLVLNAAWTPVFFGAREPGWGLVVIIALWAAIMVTLILFLRVRKLAGVLLIPYAAWVSFAAFLNYTLWQLNIPARILPPPP